MRACVRCASRWGCGLRRRPFMPLTRSPMPAGSTTRDNSMRPSGRPATPRACPRRRMPRASCSGESNSSDSGARRFPGSSPAPFRRSRRSTLAGSSHATASSSQSASERRYISKIVLARPLPCSTPCSTRRGRSATLRTNACSTGGRRRWIGRHSCGRSRSEPNCTVASQPAWQRRFQKIQDRTPRVTGCPPRRAGMAIRIGR